jgi:HPt (histidine-containing phosphotransfer) domain-containing protein
MSEAYEEAYRELQREYLEELPKLFAELVLPALRGRFHRLAGSGGSYGFPEISEIARAAERLVMSDTPPAEAGKLDDAVKRLEAVLTVARARFTAGPGCPRPDFAPCWCSRLAPDATSSPRHSSASATPWTCARGRTTPSPSPPADAPTSW